MIVHACRGDGPACGRGVPGIGPPTCKSCIRSLATPPRAPRPAVLHDEVGPCAGEEARLRTFSRSTGRRCYVSADGRRLYLIAGPGEAITCRSCLRRVP